MDVLYGAYFSLHNFHRGAMRIPRLLDLVGADYLGAQWSYEHHIFEGLQARLDAVLQRDFWKYQAGVLPWGQVRAVDPDTAS